MMPLVQQMPQGLQPVQQLQQQQQDRQLMQQRQQLQQQRLEIQRAQVQSDGKPASTATAMESDQGQGRPSPRSASPGDDVQLSDFEVLDRNGGSSLGKGSFGVVRKIRRKGTDDVYALKTMQKIEVINGQLIDQVEREIQVQRRLKHENVLRLYQHFEDADTVYLLLEYCAKGELYQLLRTQRGRRFTESVSRHFFVQLVKGLKYMHSQNIVHRDLKPENLLITHDDVLKIGDFGWCCTATNVLRTTFCGTMDYLAPEMIEATGHDHTLDIWGTGILLYEMMVGRPPFQSTNQNILIQRIRKVEINFPSSLPGGVVDLVSRLLQKDPASRIPLANVLKHPWVVSSESHEQQLQQQPQPIPSQQSQQSQALTQAQQQQSLSQQSLQSRTVGQSQQQSQQSLQSQQSQHSQQSLPGHQSQQPPQSAQQPTPLTPPQRQQQRQSQAQQPASSQQQSKTSHERSRSRNGQMLGSQSGRTHSVDQARPQASPRSADASLDARAPYSSNSANTTPAAVTAGPTTQAASQATPTMSTRAAPRKSPWSTSPQQMLGYQQPQQAPRPTPSPAQTPVLTRRGVASMQQSPASNLAATLAAKGMTSSQGAPVGSGLGSSGRTTASVSDSFRHGRPSRRESPNGRSPSSAASSRDPATATSMPPPSHRNGRGPSDLTSSMSSPFKSASAIAGSQNAQQLLQNSSLQQSRPRSGTGQSVMMCAGAVRGQPGFPSGRMPASQPASPNLGGAARSLSPIGPHGRGAGVTTAQTLASAMRPVPRASPSMAVAYRPV